MEAGQDAAGVRPELRRRLLLVRMRRLLRGRVSESRGVPRVSPDDSGVVLPRHRCGPTVSQSRSAASKSFIQIQPKSEFARHAVGCPQATAIQIEGRPMLSHFGRALRALAVTVALSAAIAPASAQEGHDHGEQPPVSAGALPRGEADSNTFEIVAIVRGENLEIYLDRFATNEPVTGATLEVESPQWSRKSRGRCRRHIPGGSAVARKGRTKGPDLHGYGGTPPTFCR